MFYMNTDTRRYVEVMLSNGSVVTKKATREFTHAIVTDEEVLSWHTGENAGHRRLYRIHQTGARLVRVQVAR